MSGEQLQNHLKELHQLLQYECEPDSETRQLLERVTADISEVLNRQEGESSMPAPETLTERVRVALLEFESKHPQISGLVERIADGLAGLGI